MSRLIVKWHARYFGAAVERVKEGRSILRGRRPVAYMYALGRVVDWEIETGATAQHG